MLCQKFQVGVDEAEDVTLGEAVVPVASAEDCGLREGVPVGEIVVFVASGDTSEGEGVVVGVLTELVAAGDATSGGVWA